MLDERLRGADDAVIASRSHVEGRVLVTLNLDFGNLQGYPSLTARWDYRPQAQETR